MEHTKHEIKLPESVKFQNKLNLELFDGIADEIVLDIIIDLVNEFNAMVITVEENKLFYIFFYDISFLRIDREFIESEKSSFIKFQALELEYFMQDCNSEEFDNLRSAVKQIKGIIL